MQIPCASCRAPIEQGGRQFARLVSEFRLATGIAVHPRAQAGGFCFSFLNGHGPNDFEINEVVSRLYILFWGIWLVSMVWLAVGRARDAGRGTVRWTVAGLVFPACWIVLGCLPSRRQS